MIIASELTCILLKYVSTWRLNTHLKNYRSKFIYIVDILNHISSAHFVSNEKKKQIGFSDGDFR